VHLVEINSREFMVASVLSRLQVVATTRLSATPFFHVRLSCDQRSRNSILNSIIMYYHISANGEELICCLLQCHAATAGRLFATLGSIRCWGT